MAKHLSPPPRKLSWLTRLLVFNSHVYSLGGWVATGIGCLIMWFCYTVSRPAALDRPGVYVNLLGLVAFLLIGMVFLGIGLASLIYFTFKNGWREVWLLRYGEVAVGKWTENEKKGIGLEPNKTVGNYFTFETKEGITHQGTSIVNSKDGYKLKDGVEKLILYKPENPDQLVAFDAIPNAPAVLPDGRFGPIPKPRAGILIAPLLVLLLNIGFYTYHFGSSEGKNLSELYDEAFDYYQSGEGGKAQEAYQIFIESLEDKPPSDLYFIDHERAQDAYFFVSKQTKDKEKKQRYLQHTIKHMGLIDQAEPIDTAWQKNMALSYYNISRYALYEQFFAEAERTARKAVELDPAAHLYIAHLPAALLFQGEYMEAQGIYLKWKGQLVPYPWRMEDEALLGSLFLRDLEQIEGTTANRMDVERAKALLGQ